MEEKPNIKADLERKQREAKEKLIQKGDVVAPEIQPAALPKQPVRVDKSAKPVNQSREDRLAELRRKSEALKKAAPSAQSAELTPVEAVEQAVESLEIEDSEHEALMESTLSPIVPDDAPVKVKNIFKQIETKVVKPDNRRRGRRRFDKKGGGRQKQEKRLNRQKYLEYKYAARDILDNPEVPEEHRSNVLGQIWAKGERVSIEESLTFIEQKEAELVLPSTVADSLRDLVKRMTTRR